MEKFDILKDIAQRTGGDIYIGVVGPVRTGKSTFIKRFMELLVLPHIADAHDRERARDALPQSGAGRTVMTTEPKFIPDEGVQITVRENIQMRVRMVDCVGYTVEGALGYQEEHGPRMVLTPWFDYEIPFQEAAEVGTRKVIAEHSTIGLVVTTDGSISEIPRESYVAPEERVVTELKEIGKPFVILLNSTHPEGEETRVLVDELERKYNVSVVPMDCAAFNQEDVTRLLEKALYEFPVKQVQIILPDWVEQLESRHWLRQKFEGVVRDTMPDIRRLRDVEAAVTSLNLHDFVQTARLQSMDLGTGLATIELTAPENLFYQVLADMSGYTVQGRHHIIRMMRELVVAKREYDKVADALREVRQSGYGMVAPSMSELTFEEPELMKRGHQFGVKLRASAPSIHMIRADIQAEVTPLIGTEKQAEELVQYLMDQFEDDPKKIWESDIFGKSLREIMKEGIQGKLFRMPENAQEKLQETLQRIVNEGSGGLICIII